MTKFSVGDDVIVDFGGLEHPGEVISQSSGYVMVKILADPNADYGRVSSMLDPEPTVAVKESKVRHASIRQLSDNVGPSA